VRVAPLDVVEVFDVVADGAQRGFTSRIALVVDELGAQGGEEALGNGIIPAIARPTRIQLARDVEVLRRTG
jgi:hypothetical protein